MLPYKLESLINQEKRELYPREVRKIFTHDNHAILIHLNDQEAMLTKQVATNKNESNDLSI